MNNVQTINHIVGFYAVISSHHNQMFIENTRPYHNAIYWVWYLFYSKIYWISFFYTRASDPIFTVMECFVYIAEIHLLRLLLFSLGSEIWWEKSTWKSRTREKRIIEMLSHNTYTYTHICMGVCTAVCVCACLGVKRMEFGKCLQNMFQIMKAPKGWKVDETVQT